MIFKKGSTRKARKFATFLYETPRAGREAAMRSIIGAIVKACGDYGTVHRKAAVQEAVYALCSRGFELGDCTFLNVVWSSPPFIQLSEYDKVCTEMLLEFFQFIGASWEQTRKFCGVMFPDYIEQLAEPLQRGKAGVDIFFRSNRPLFAAIVQESAYSAVADGFVFSDWLSRLIDAADSGDSEVDGWFELVWLTLTTHSPRVSIVSQSKAEAALAGKGMTLDDYALTSFDNTNPQIVVRDDQYVKCGRFALRIIDRPKAGAELLRAWFHDNRGQLVRSLRKKREEIIDAACALRNKGRDWIDVSKSPLLSGLVIDAIQFVPINAAWPDMDVVITVRRLGSVPCAYHGSLINLSLTINNALFDWCEEEDGELWIVALEAVIIHALHLIVVQKTFSQQGFGRQTESGNIGRRAIRPHFPRLPKGKKMSKEAYDRCIGKGFKPRSGRTFNKGHEPDGDDIDGIVDYRHFPPVVALGNEPFVL